VNHLGVAACTSNFNTPVLCRHDQPSAADYSTDFIRKNVYETSQCLKRERKTGNRRNEKDIKSGIKKTNMKGDGSIM